MSVIRGRKIIFCEGKQTSLDSQLLNRIVDNLPGDKPTIVGAGSKFTFSVFAEGYFFPDEVVNQRFIIFRDRDFDAVPNSANIQLLQFGRQPIFLTHRACIENYLLDENLIHTYWETKYKEKIDNPSSKWGHGSPPEIENISKWIKDSAYTLKDYQSIRWALGDLLQMQGARIQLKTTWTGSSGKLPVSLSLPDCHNDAVRLIENFRNAIETVTIEQFEKSLTKYQNQFSQSEFWEQKQYLVWFHGKDIQKAMQRQESRYISLGDFFDSMISQFDFTQYPDLVELRAKIEQL